MALHPAVVRSIFTSYSSNFAKHTAKIFRMSVYMVNYAWQRWCRRLEALSERHRQEVYEACQISWKVALASFVHNARELMWICRHWRQRLAARVLQAQLTADLLAERRAHALRLFALFAPEGSITGSIYEDTCLYMEMAVTAAAKPGFRPGRYLGELTQRELAKVRRSDFSWVFLMLKTMYSHQVVECFGQNGLDFVEVCEWTYAGRSQRRKERIARSEVGIEPPTASSTGGTGGRYTYLPKPDAAPNEIAMIIVENHPALIAV